MGLPALALDAEESEKPLVQIVITRLRDGRFRIICFDDHEVVDELATENLDELFELKDRLHSLGKWEAPR